MSTILIIILLILAAISLVLSFMKKSDTASLEKEIDERSVHLLKENSALRERINRIEDVLQIDSSNAGHNFATEQINLNELLKQEITVLYTSGVSPENIAIKTATPLDKVEKIIYDYVHNVYSTRRQL